MPPSKALWDLTDCILLSMRFTNLIYDVIYIQKLRFSRDSIRLRFCLIINTKTQQVRKQPLFLHQPNKKGILMRQEDRIHTKNPRMWPSYHTCVKSGHILEFLRIMSQKVVGGWIYQCYWASHFLRVGTLTRPGTVEVGGREDHGPHPTFFSVAVGNGDVVFPIVHELTCTCKLQQEKPRSNGTSRAN